MKTKITKWLFLFAALSFLLFAQTLPCCAAELELPKELENRNELQMRADALSENLSFSSLWEKACDTFSETFSPTLKTFAGLLSLTILCALAQTLAVPTGGGSVAGCVGVLCFSANIFAVLESLEKALCGYADTLKSLTAALLPTLIAASAADGVMTAKTGYTGMATALFVIEILIDRVVLPIVKILTVLSLAGCLTENFVELRGIASSLRTFGIFAVTLSMTAVVTVLHFQHVIARAADSVGLRAVRFASASLIPLVGGLVGESAKTVTEALRSVKEITGAAGAAAVLSAFLPPVCTILIFKGELLFCNCLAKTLLLRKESAYLGEINGILNLLAAAIFAVTIGFSAVICLVADAV